MARSLNKAMLIGNLGSDPEVRSTASGVRVATLSVATNRRWTDRAGDQQEKTEWHRVVAWNRLAEICERFLRKGDRVYVEGSIEYDKWEGQDGQTRYTTEIRARDMVMLGSGGAGGDSYSPPGPRRREKSDLSEFSDRSVAGEDDLPF